MFLKCHSFFFPKNIIYSRNDFAFLCAFSYRSFTIYFYSPFSNYHNSSYPISSRTFIFRIYIYTQGERRKLGKVGNWIFFMPIFSSSPAASFDGIDIEPIKRITGKLFLPRITMLVGKTYRSKCRNAGRALGDPLLFENARIEKERERKRECASVSREFTSGVVTSTSFAMKSFRDLARPRITKPWNGSQQQHLRDQTRFREKKEIRPATNPCDYPFFPRKTSLANVQPFNPEKFHEIQANIRLHGIRMRVLLIREIFAQFVKACNFYRGCGAKLGWRIKAKKDKVREVLQLVLQLILLSL